MNYSSVAHLSNQFKNSRLSPMHFKKMKERRRNQLEDVRHLKRKQMIEITEAEGDELSIARKELALQMEEKEQRAAELILANKELAFQNKEKKKRATELDKANLELALKAKKKEN